MIRNKKPKTKKDRTSTVPSQKLLDLVNVETRSDDEDDDVICIPAPPPPLVCIESTDNETDNEETNVNSGRDSIVVNDQNSEKIGTDLLAVSANARLELRNSNDDDSIARQNAASLNVSTTNSAAFEPNAVESECTDLIQNRLTNTSDLDCESDDDGMLFLEILKDTSTPDYVQRGEAIKTVKSHTKKKRMLRTARSTISYRSEDEFLPELSSESNDDDDQCNRDSADDLSSEASEVVDQVLEKSSEIPILLTVDNAMDENVCNIEQATATGLSLENTNNFEEVSEPITGDQSQSAVNVDLVSPNVLPSVTPTNSNGTDKTNSTVTVDPEIGWNDEMKRFYHNSWGGESFNVTVAQRPMTNGRFEWNILEIDKVGPILNDPNNALRCNNCYEKGHQLQDCSLPPRQIKCHMCGEAGHSEPRCPHSMCLRCGFKSSAYIFGCNYCAIDLLMKCLLCNTIGHRVRDCPDKWRRYHSTIDSGQPLKRLPLMFNKPRYCSMCAGKGHTAEYCRNQDSLFPPVRIQSYTNVYDPIDQEEPAEPYEDVARFALISAPVENVQFSWDVDESPNRFYGRVISATNITRIKNRPLDDVDHLNLIGNSKENHLASTGSGSAANNSPSVRNRKVNKRLREAAVISTDEYAENGASAPKIRTDSHQRNKHIRFKIKVQSTDDDQLNNTQEQFDSVVSTPVVNRLLDGLAGPISGLKEPLINNNEAITPSSKPNNAMRTKSIDDEPSHKEEFRIPCSTETATPPAKRIRFDSISKESLKSCKITESLEELKSFGGTDIGQADFIPFSNSDRSTICNHQVDTEPSQSQETETTVEKNAIKWRVTVKRLPANRLSLIQFIQGQLFKLMQSHGDANELYRNICVQESINIRRAMRMRRTLNIILMGQMGLRNGATHLRLLKSILNSLLLGKKIFTTFNTRLNVFRHYEYIFSPFEHDDYPALLNEYNAIQEQRLLAGTAAPTVLRGVDNDELKESNNKSTVASEIMSFDDSGVSNVAEWTPPNNPSCSPFQRQFIEDDKHVPTTMAQQTIFMLQAQYNCMQTMLLDTYAKHGVMVHVKHFKFCVVILVGGIESALRLFKRDLIDYIQTEIQPDVPKKSDGLIKFFRFKHRELKFNFPRAGDTFLTYREYDGGVRVEWNCFGSIWIVEGRTKAQNNFRNALIVSCQNNDTLKWMRKNLKDRMEVIRFIEDNLEKLLKSYGNAREIYERICLAEIDLHTTAEANLLRSKLNIILMGQARLRKGAYHLQALQSIRKFLLAETQFKVSNKIRNDAISHQMYIFSTTRHYDYPELLNEYEAMHQNRNSTAAVDGAAAIPFENVKL